MTILHDDRLLKLVRMVLMWVRPLVVIFIAWRLVLLSYLFLPQLPLEYIPEKISSASIQSNYLLPMEVSQRNLFGVYVKDHVPPEPEKLAIKEKPKKPLNIELIGVLAMSPEELSTAVILQNQQAVAKVYGIGDDIADSVTLTHIYSDRIIISHTGLQEVIQFKTQPSVSVFPNLVNHAGTGSGINVNQSGASSKKSGRENKVRTTENYYESFLSASKRSRFNLVESKLFTEREQMFKNFGLEKKEHNYRVTKKVPLVVREYFQVRIGDEIQRMNGTAVTSIEQVAKAFAQARKSQGIQLMVKRNGRILNLDTVAIR